MTRALVFTDLQATEGHERTFADAQVPLQRYRVQRFYDVLRDIYSEYRCNALWDLGDTTDDRTAIPIPTLATLLSGIAKIPRSSADIKLIGNHEQHLRTKAMHSGCLYQGWNVVDSVKTFVIDGVAVICLSYPQGTYNELQSALVTEFQLHRQYPAIVLGHIDVIGSRMNSGISLSGLPVDSFDGANLTLLGHIHLPQQVGDRQVHYVGSPFQQSFGELGESKRVAVVELDAGVITSVEWISTDADFPQYHRGSLPEFLNRPNPQSEDRWEVVLRNLDETTAFHACPDAPKARAILDYARAEPEQSDNRPQAAIAAPPQLLRQFVKATPPQFGFDVDDEDLVGIGLDIMSEPR